MQPRRYSLNRVLGSWTLLFAVVTALVASATPVSSGQPAADSAVEAATEKPGSQEDKTKPGRGWGKGGKKANSPTSTTTVPSTTTTTTTTTTTSTAPTTTITTTTTSAAPSPPTSSTTSTTTTSTTTTSPPPTTTTSAPTTTTTTSAPPTTTTQVPPPSGLVWHADYETGDTSQWDGVWISGDASSQISTTMARSGRYGNALTIYNANGSGSSPGVRMTYQGRDLAHRTDPQNLPTEAYYSAWYYVPEHVTVSWWNIFQWKTGYDDGSGRTARALYWHDLYNEDDGTLYLELKARVNGNGEWVKGWSTTLATSPTPIPIGQWFHLESYYKWDRNGNGQLTTWLDGVQIWNVTGLTTEFDWPFNVYKREWAINNYANDTTPTTHTIYVDDAAISTTRLGP